MISYHDFLLKCLSLVYYIVYYIYYIVYYIRLNYESHIFTIPKFIDSTMRFYSRFRSRMNSNTIEDSTISHKIDKHLEIVRLSVN